MFSLRDFPVNVRRRNSETEKVCLGESCDDISNLTVYETCQTTNPYPDTNPYTLDTDPYPVYTDSYPVKFFFCIFLTYFFVENSALNSSLGNWKKFLKKVFLP